MSDDLQNITAVESILAERDALHAWLGRIDQAGSTAPQAVRARVRVDYERRLEAVTDRLRGHGDAIKSRLAADRSEYEDLTSRARVSRDALAEAELRHAVGEFSSARFEQERAQHTGDLETFELSLGAVAERVAQLEDVEGLISRPTAERSQPTVDAPNHGSATPAIESVAEAARSEPILVPEQPNADAEVTPTGLVEQAIEADDEAYLSIFEPVDEPDQSPSIQPTAEERPKHDLPDRGRLSFTPRPGGSPARPAAVPSEVPPLGMTGTDQRPRFVRPASDRGSELAGTDVAQQGAPEQVGRMDVGVVELTPEPVLPDPAVDAGPRTLRCGECGAMNRPLEWYCEKCGAELTAG